MKKFNKDKLVSIKIQDFTESSYYIYKERTTFLGICTREEGFYSWIYNNLEPEEHILKNHIIKDNKVYNYPYVLLTYQNNDGKRYDFNTMGEAIIFHDEISKDINWIK